MSKKIARRQFMKLSAGAAAGYLVHSGSEAQAQDLPHITEDDPLAVGLKYTHDASAVDPATRSQPAAEQSLYEELQQQLDQDLSTQALVTNVSEFLSGVTRLAGTQEASRATAPRTTGTVTNVTKSSAGTPYNSRESSLDKAAARSSPTPPPTSTSFMPDAVNIRTTDVGSAPSDRRIPTSRALRDTA